MPRVVISDTSPVRYLVLIGQVELLSALYTEVLIPEAVADELQQSSTSWSAAGLPIDPPGSRSFPRLPGPLLYPSSIWIVANAMRSF